MMSFKFEKRYTIIGLMVLAFSAMALLLNRVQAADEAQSAVTVVSIDPSQSSSAAKRLGINTGAHDQYGAAQILKNLIPNPGFESGEIAMIFQVNAGATGTRIQADNWDTTWNNYSLGIGHIPDYWTYGSYEVLTGPAKGRTGSIAAFTHDDNKYTFTLNNDGAWPSTGDVVSVRKNLGGYEWDTQPNAKADASTRPNSPGTQSLKLMPSSGPSLNVYFDSYSSQDPNAGKMLTVEGNWRISFWAKAANAGDSLEVNFRRNGGSTFVNQTFPLTNNWQLITHDFSPPANSDGWVSNPGTLILSFQVLGSGDIFIDDAELYRRDFTNSTVFVDPYVDRLKELRPGILRNWGAQLGSSLDNQLAEPWARKTTGHSPKFSVARDYHYSLHEFLELADVVGAEPWYVIPPTFTPAEVQNLMAYLSAPAGSHPYADKRANLGQSAPWTTRFNQIHLEYGNEIWGSNATGDPFIGATMRGGINAGQVANDRFALMKSSPYYQAGRFNFVIGGQTGYAGRQGELEANSSNHNSIGFGPYFGKLNQWSTDADRFQPLYAHAKETVQQGKMKDSESIIWNAGQGTQMSIYEINLHTVDGPSPVSARDDVMTSLGGGIALPLTMLTYQRDMNIVNQAAFQSLQYSTQRGSDNVRGWGTAS